MTAPELSDDIRGPVLDYLTRRCGVPKSDAERGLTELVKFLTLVAHTDARLTPSDAVDQVWHAFVLNTREYNAFCEANYGRYIHHDHVEDEGTLDRYAQTRQLLASAYGGLDRRLWPAGMPAQCGAGPG